jgi:thioredoxin 1
MKIVNAVEFDATTKKGVVLVDFSAEWCGPCKMIAPVLEQLSEELSGKVEIIKVDVDVEQQLAQKYNVMSIPTLLLFKDGNVIGQVVGFQSKAMLEKFIQRAYVN